MKAGMKNTFKLILSIFLVTTLIEIIFTYFQIEIQRRRYADELFFHSSIVAGRLIKSMQESLYKNSSPELKQLVQQISVQEGFSGIIIYDTLCTPIESISYNIPALKNSFVNIRKTIKEGKNKYELASIGENKMYLYTFLFFQNKKPNGALLIIHDTFYINNAIQNILGFNLLQLLVQSFLIIITTVIVFHITITGPITNVVRWMKNIRTGRTFQQMNLPKDDILKPLADEAALLTKSLSIARSNAEEEARLRVQTESIWTSERLKEFVRQEINDKNLIIVSNREPYMHIKHGSNIECIVPAGGLVTALDPVLKACGGVWIAQGSGNADQEVADSDGKLQVPPDEPSYFLKRVFISKEEEQGYYFGFANEGIWPLCHITHTRPDFRLADWEFYQSVNQKFANSVLNEIKDQKEPLILIQDYHFALLPQMIKSINPMLILLYSGISHGPIPKFLEYVHGNRKFFSVCLEPTLLVSIFNFIVIIFLKQSTASWSQKSIGNNLLLKEKVGQLW